MYISYRIKMNHDHIMTWWRAYQKRYNEQGSTTILCSRLAYHVIPQDQDAEYHHPNANWKDPIWEWTWGGVQVDHQSNSTSKIRQYISLINRNRNDPFSPFKFKSDNSWSYDMTGYVQEKYLNEETKLKSIHIPWSKSIKKNWKESRCKSKLVTCWVEEDDQ